MDEMLVFSIVAQWLWTLVLWARLKLVESELGSLGGIVSRFNGNLERLAKSHAGMIDMQRSTVMLAEQSTRDCARFHTECMEIASGLRASEERKS